MYENNLQNKNLLPCLALCYAYFLHFSFLFQNEHETPFFEAFQVYVQYRMFVRMSRYWAMGTRSCTTNFLIITRPVHTATFVIKKNAVSSCSKKIDIFFFGSCRFFLDFLKIIIMSINVIHQLLIFSQIQGGLHVRNL